MKIIDLIKKYKSVILYLFFGLCTTLVNIASYWFMARIVKTNVTISTIVAWIIAVLFAYITNRKWVFNSDAHTLKSIIKEIVSFFSCRLATGVLDLGCMVLFVDVLHFNDLLIKIISNFLVIVLNYIASKLLIFRKKKQEE